MKVLAWVALLLATFACNRRSTSTTQASPNPEQSAVLGAGPGEFFPSLCMGQEDLRVWRRVDLTAVTPDMHEKSRGSHCDWSVVMRQGVPIVSAKQHDGHPLPSGFSPLDNPGRPSAVQQRDAGVLLGFDRGEWGGSLRWYSRKGALERRLLDDNVVAILPAFEQFLVLTYFGHGSRPRVVEVREVAGRFELGRTIDLPAKPSAGAIDSQGDVLIVTGKGLFKVTRHLQVEALLETNWWMFHPGALALGRDSTAYVGMRGAVVEVQLSTRPPKQTWLYPF